MIPKKLWPLFLAVWLILNGLNISVGFPVLGSLNNVLALATGILILLGIR